MAFDEEMGRPMTNGYRRGRTERPALHAVIPAGGSGTRLWPASRATNPKFLLPLPGPRSMLQATVDRLAPIVPLPRILVVTGAAHAISVGRQLPEIPEQNVLIEPSPRGTGPAIGLAAALIARQDPAAIMGSFAADHYVARPDLFQQAVLAAAEIAEQGYLVTIGITPTYPETGYGYIRAGESLGHFAAEEVFRVDEFKEKPDAATATAYVESGRYLWNASMFVWRAATLLEEMRRLLPDVAATLEQIAAAWDTPEREHALETLWPGLRDVTIDHGIMERAPRVAVVPAGIGWTDLGDWHSLGDVLAATSGDNVVVSGRHLAEDTRNTLVFGGHRMIATLGVENLVIVDTEDVVLVCDRARAQEVRRIVERLKESGEHLLT